MSIMKKRLFWPLLTLLVILAVNLLFTPVFFHIEVKNGHLYGSLIDILNRASPLILVSIGMTLVIATKGIDLSVGSVISIAGATAAVQVAGYSGEGGNWVPLLTAVVSAIIISMAAGLWNGFLVSVIRIQPIVATLILMVAGRGVAQLITDGQIVTISYEPYSFIGGGYLLMLPFSLFIVAAILIAAALLTRKTAVGLFIEAVGSNPLASRFSGVNARAILLLVYLFCGLCSGIAGLILSSNVTSADGNNAGLWYELDAILAVVIGGTSLNGGRFYLSGTVIGALIIQSLTTTIYTIGIPPEITLVVKALVIAAVCLIQSEAFRAQLSRSRKRRKSDTPKGVAV